MGDNKHVKGLISISSVYAISKHITDDLTETSLDKCLTFGFSSRICWRISLCFSSSLSCLLLCASSSCVHTNTHTLSESVAHLRPVHSVSYRAMSSLTRLMYCTTSLTNDLLISSFSLWGDFFPQLNQQSSIFSIYWHLVVTPVQPGLSVTSRHLLFCHILVFGFGIVDLLLPLLVHFLLEVLLFSKEQHRDAE